MFYWVRVHPGRKSDEGRDVAIMDFGVNVGFWCVCRVEVHVGLRCVWRVEVDVELRCMLG